MNIGTLPDNSLGFDCDEVVSAEDAAKFRASDFSFAMRYVGRNIQAAHDISNAERTTLLSAGLAITLVQHCPNPKWIPTPALGMAWGANAALFAKAAGFPSGINLWCDLEEVSTAVEPQAVIDYCVEWFDGAERGGYVPGLYVGDGCGIPADLLYRSLPFEHYTAGYNLNRDRFPVVRGVQMRQHPYPPAGLRVAGIAFEYDIDIIVADSLGGTPILLLPN